MIEAQFKLRQRIEAQHLHIHNPVGDRRAAAQVERDVVIVGTAAMTHHIQQGGARGGRDRRELVATGRAVFGQGKCLVGEAGEEAPPIEPGCVNTGATEELTALGQAEGGQIIAAGAVEHHLANEATGEPIGIERVAAGKPQLQG